jgi:uncharacterized protein YxjI
MSWGRINQYLVKEHVGMFKAANNFDIFDLETGEEVLRCREPNLGFFSKMLRFTDYKQMTPFLIEITDTDGNLIAEVSRGISIFLSTVDVHDGSGNYLGGFKQKMFSIGGAFSVLDEEGDPICDLKGKWTGWDFQFVAGNNVLARVTKKWSGIGKEMFTSADNYVLDISESVPDDSAVRKLIFSAVMCIDMVLKE